MRCWTGRGSKRMSSAFQVPAVLQAVAPRLKAFWVRQRAEASGHSSNQASEVTLGSSPSFWSHAHSRPEVILCASPRHPPCEQIRLPKHCSDWHKVKTKMSVGTQQKLGSMEPWKQIIHHCNRDMKNSAMDCS